MKKILFGMCVILTTSFTHLQAQVNIKKLCLNGFTYDDAVNMRNTLIGGDTSATKTTSVWFSMTVIKQMVALMNTEKGPKGQIANGIRIYYGLLNSQHTVILVSTYQDVNSAGGSINQDYFEHDKNNALFSIQGVNGAPTDIASLNSGADLYLSCGTPCPDDKLCMPPVGFLHYITRKHAEDMVHYLSLIPSKINTNSEWFPLCLFSTLDSSYDGIRIYFGKHLSTDVDYPNRDTFVIEATKSASIQGTTPGSAINIHEDSFDCKFSNCNQESLSSVVNKYLFRLHKTKDYKYRKALLVYLKGTGVDNGELCPTNCYGVTLPVN